MIINQDLIEKINLVLFAWIKLEIQMLNNNYTDMHDFVNSYEFTFTKDELKSIKIRNIIVHFIDIYGEVRRLSQYKDNEERLTKQINFINKLCEAVYIDPNITEPYKKSLKIAHYQVLDYYLYGNTLKQSEKGAILWFRQWSECYNTSLLKFR